MTRQSTIAALRTPPPVVLPSLLLCDFGNLEREVREVEAAGARALHLDIMDGVFVDNITYGMPIVEAVRRVTELPLDVHLMIANPVDYIDAFADAGASTMTVASPAKTSVSANTCPRSVESPRRTNFSCMPDAASSAVSRIRVSRRTAEASSIARVFV